jgi:putative redox protein
MRHVVRIGQHAITVDEPPGNGGEDSGPTPHDLYDAALGACKALTMVWFARRKGIPLEGVEVNVVRDDSNERAGTYRLRAELSLGGPLAEAQREQLLAVASKCPVHKLMVEVKTEVETVWKPET